MSDLATSIAAPVDEWLEACRGRIAPYERSGAVLSTEGEVVVASNMGAAIGSRCEIKTDTGLIGAEVVGLSGRKSLLMADRGIQGLRLGDRVTASPGPAAVMVGNGLLGRVLGAYGEPLDGRPLPPPTEFWPLEGKPINPMRRARMSEPLDVGVRAINGIATIGVGMRAGLFAGSGVGKSTLLGMMARHAQVDCVVLAMIGERGREVREFVEDHLGDALARAVVVVSGADSPPLARLLGAQRAASIAEAFRTQGKSVLLLVDSLTRLAMAGREIGLSIGEPAATKGYPPSVFAKLAGFVERAGMGQEGEGSITGLFTVLVEGDDHVGDPVADAARSVLDGHIVLSRRMSEAGVYPPVDLTMSLSRPMPSLVTKEHNDLAVKFRYLWSRLMEKRELVDIGAYAPGRDPVLDEALNRSQKMEGFLRQAAAENISLERSVSLLREILN